ncbi:MAG: polysaccharide deacetylase family protein [Paracoccaceae bacterium]
MVGKKKTWAIGALAMVSLLAALGWGTRQIGRAHEFALFGELVFHVDTDRPVVALSFDDGPTAAHTRTVLDILEDAGVTATFFLIGQEVEKNPAAASAIAAAGHEIGNHSYSHPHMVFMRPARVRAELDRTDAAIRAAGYAGPIPFRPPFGWKLVVLPRVLAAEGRPMVMWSVEPESDPGRTAEELVAATLDAAGPGDIILLHPMYAARETTRAALPAIIAGLRAKGLEPVTVGELLSDG